MTTLTIGIITSLKIVSESTNRAPCGCIRLFNMGNITGALWWTCIPISDVCNTKIQYVVKLIIKPKSFSPFARQPALTWQEVCTQILAQMLQPSIKTIRSPRTQLWHILAVYIMRPCDLHLWHIFPKNGSHDPEVVMNVSANWEVYRRFHMWNIRS